MSLLYKLKNILKTDDHLSPVEKKINYLFHNREYLVQAFTHKSITPYPRKNYERLEFLGDSIFSMIISEYIFFNFPDANEGELTKLKAKIISRENLNQIGEKIKKNSEELSYVSETLKSLITI